MTIDPDDLHRTLKLELDSGKALSETDAEAIAKRYELQLIVGDGVSTSETRQAMLLTAANAGARAFLGGVHIVLTDDFMLTTPWAHGSTVRAALGEFDGVQIVHTLDPSKPVIVIGASSTDSEWPLYLTWKGWSAGVVCSNQDRLDESSEFAVAGVLAGALAVSEVFQWTRGYKVAAARTVGLSLWRPELDWRSEKAAGPAVKYLPSNIWLLGLGHLGQAYSWVLGFLPYRDADRAQVRLLLQDYDRVVKANESTGMLVRAGARGMKTRLAAHRLETIGFQPRITERAFDRHTRRADDEPRIALAGFHGTQPRQQIEQADFAYAIDVGLGATAADYLAIRLHTFPSSRPAADVFDQPAATIDETLLSQAAYKNLIQRALESQPGMSEEAVRCGILEIASRAVGAAFVGTVAATIAISEALRAISGGPRYEIIDLSLRSPHYKTTMANKTPMPVVNLGFLPVR